MDAMFEQGVPTINMETQSYSADIEAVPQQSKGKLLEFVILGTERKPLSIADSHAKTV